MKTSAQFSTYDEVKFDLSPPRSQVLWPAHCIQHSEGAKLAGDLTVSSLQHILVLLANAVVFVYNKLLGNVNVRGL